MTKEEGAVVPGFDEEAFLAGRLGDADFVPLALGFHAKDPGATEALIEKFGEFTPRAQFQTMSALFELDAQGLRTSALSAREFSTNFQRTMLLDEVDVEPYQNTRRYLHEVEKANPAKFKRLTRSLPTQLMIEKLDMLDAGVCGSKRLSQYIYFLSNKLVHDEKVFEENVWKDNANEPLADSVAVRASALDGFLNQLEERIEMFEEDELIEVVCREFLDTKRGEVPWFIISALEHVAYRRNNSLAQTMLDVINGHGSEWSGQAQGDWPIPPDNFDE